MQHHVVAMDQFTATNLAENLGKFTAHPCAWDNARTLVAPHRRESGKRVFVGQGDCDAYLSTYRDPLIDQIFPFQISALVSCSSMFCARARNGLALGSCSRD